MWASWFKGHATEDSIAKGVATLASKAGNDRADGLAEKGVGMHDYGIQELAKCYLHRQAFYIIIMQKLHALYVAVHKADTEKREAMARRNVFVLGGKGVSIAVAVPLHLPYGEAELGRTLDLVNPLASCNRSEHSPFFQIWSFLFSRQFVPTSPTQQGISWLELLAMFELCGGSVDITRNILVNRARSRYREAGITCFAMRSHMIAMRRVTCDSAEWRRHVILPNGVACDCDFGVAGFESAVV